MNLVADRRHIHTITQVYKSLNDLAPDRIKSQFKYVGEDQEEDRRTTRSVTRRDLEIPNLKLKVSRRSFKYRGAHLYNMVDDDIRKKDTLNQFKRALAKSDMFALV